jgi:hypothetical protein
MTLLSLAVEDCVSACVRPGRRFTRFTSAAVAVFSAVHELRRVCSQGVGPARFGLGLRPPQIGSSRLGTRRRCCCRPGHPAPTIRAHGNEIDAVDPKGHARVWTDPSAGGLDLRQILTDPFPDYLWQAAEGRRRLHPGDAIRGEAQE